MPFHHNIPCLFHDEAVYIIVSVNLYIGNYISIVHYVYAVLDCNTGTWWNCYDGKINHYSGYTVYVYDNVSNENEQKKGGECNMNVSDSILSMLYIKRDILASSTYSFCNGKSVSKDIENIKEIIAEFKVFK